MLMNMEKPLERNKYLFFVWQVVPDSEEMLKSPVIPAPPLVRIPSRSPHKSALASPGRKKSPSPKRVQFVSQVRLYLILLLAYLHPFKTVMLHFFISYLDSSSRNS